MRYTVLSRVRTDEIVECVNKAFSDYAKPIHFTESTLHSFLWRAISIQPCLFALIQRTPW